MKDSKEEVIRQYMSDMLGVEKHTLESVERQVRDEKVRPFREAYDLLLKIESTLRIHTLALDQHLSALTAAAGGNYEVLLKKAATSAVGLMTGLYGMVRPDLPVSRDIRDDYTALSLGAISYTMLHTTALGLNDTQVAELALQHLKELTPLIAALSRVIPLVVAKELTDEGKAFNASAGQSAVESTQQAWSHEVIERY